MDRFTGGGGGGGGGQQVTQADLQTVHYMQQMQALMGGVTPGHPAYQEMMNQLGFEWMPSDQGTYSAWLESSGHKDTPDNYQAWLDAGGEGTYKMLQSGEEIDAQEINEMLAMTRDWLEPEMQRQLQMGQQAMEARGLGRSSIAAGIEGQMRSDYFQSMTRARYQIAQEMQARRWQRLIQAMAVAQGQAGIAGQGAQSSLGLMEQRRLQEAQEDAQRQAFWNQLAQWGYGAGQDPSSNIYINYGDGSTTSPSGYMDYGSPPGMDEGAWGIWD